MRVGLVGDLVTHPGTQPKRSSIPQFGVQLAGEAEQNMPLLAPMVGAISGRVLDHSHTERTEVSRAPARDARLALVFRNLDCRPVSRAEGNVGQMHRLEGSRSRRA